MKKYTREELCDLLDREALSPKDTPYKGILGATEICKMTGFVCGLLDSEQSITKDELKTKIRERGLSEQWIQWIDVTLEFDPHMDLYIDILHYGPNRTFILSSGDHDGKIVMVYPIDSGYGMRLNYETSFKILNKLSACYREKDKK